MFAHAASRHDPDHEQNRQSRAIVVSFLLGTLSVTGRVEARPPRELPCVTAHDSQELWNSDSEGLAGHERGVAEGSPWPVPVAEAAAHGDAATRVQNRSDAPRDTQAPTPILVVNDDPQMLRYVRDAPTAGGLVPLVAGEPEDLSCFVRTHRPGLVLLDLVLPRVNGIALMEQVAELAELPDGGWHLWDSAYHGHMIATGP